MSNYFDIYILLLSTNIKITIIELYMLVRRSSDTISLYFPNMHLLSIELIYKNLSNFGVIIFYRIKKKSCANKVAKKI